MAESGEAVRGREDPHRIQYDRTGFAGRVVKKIVGDDYCVVVVFDDGDYTSFVVSDTDNGPVVSSGPTHVYRLWSIGAITREEYDRRREVESRKAEEKERREYERLKKIYGPEGGEE